MPLLASCKLIGFVGTTDAARARIFYTDKLGLALVSDDGFAMVFDANGTMLRVVRLHEISPAAYTVLGWEVADICALAGELTGAGVVLERYEGMGQDEAGIWTAPGGAAKVAWFKDPDGNVLSISQHE